MGPGGGAEPGCRRPGGAAAWAALAAITLAALLLRLRGISGFVLDLDECFQLYAALKPSSLAGFLAMARGNPHHMLLDPLASFLVARFASDLAWFRLPPALLGTACVPILFILGRRLGGARVGLLAAAMLAASPLHVEWSGVVDFYPALVFWTLVCTLALLAAVEPQDRFAPSGPAAVSGAPAGRSRFPAAFLPLLLAQTAFAYTHPYAALVAALQAGWLLVFRRDKLAPFCMCLMASAALLLPWYMYSTRQLVDAPLFRFSEAYGWRPLGHVAWTLACWALRPERVGHLLPAMGPWTAAAAFGCLALFLAGLRGLRPSPNRPEAGWALVAGSVPFGLAGVLALDWKFSYFFTPRQTLFLLPFYLLAAARGACLLWDAASRSRSAAVRRSPGLALAAAAVLCAWVHTDGSGVLRRLRSDTLKRVAEARATLRPGDVLLFNDPNSAMVFLYHYDRRAFLRGLPPVLKDGFYTFLLPDGLEAEGAAGRNPVRAIVAPQAPPDEERRRWLDLARGSRAGLRLYHVDVGLVQPGSKAKVEEFLRLL